MAELLRPWLGEATQSDQLPLPQVIDVAVDRTTGIRSDDIHRLFEDFARRSWSMITGSGSLIL